MAHPSRSRFGRTIRRPRGPQVYLEQPRRRVPPKLRSAPLIVLAAFAFGILLGTCLLSLPIASASRQWGSPITSFFVATSAICVTGLTPVDTSIHWSGFGKAVILVLIQFGGLGFMTSATFAFLLLGSRVGVRERMLLSSSLDLSHMGGVVRLVRRALIFTAVLEALGWLILAVGFSSSEPLGRSIWWGLFHSISAFNNAGFDLTGEFRSLERHDDPLILMPVSALIVLGGIGYPVIEEILHRGRNNLSADTKIVLVMTFSLLAAGFVLFLTFEWWSTLRGMGFLEKLMHSWFHSVSPRTAGFNSLPLGQMTDETTLLTMVLMFIGGGSSSTAGGIKVGTLGVLLAAAVSGARAQAQPKVAGREIRRADVDRALTILLLAGALVVGVTAALAKLENLEFLPLAFEAISAFGTVGLSISVTPVLSDVSLLLVAATMFAGRLGPLTLVLVLIGRTRPERRRLPEERVRVG